MSIELPEAALRFIAAANADDTAGVVASFAPGATVLDEGHDVEGAEAIAAWFERASKAVGARIAVRSTRNDAGLAIARAEVSGRFPGSPVMLNFAFRIVDGRIARLEVTP